MRWHDDRIISFVVFILFVILTFNACSSDRSTTSANNGGGTALLEASANIGTSGGTVEVTNSASPLYGVKVVIPAGAVSQNTTVSIERVIDDPPLPNAAIKVSNVVSLGPNGVAFNLPVMVTVPYETTNQDNETSFRLYSYDGSSWEGVTAISQDTSTHSLAALTSHFSLFAVFQPKDDQSITSFLPSVDGLQTTNFAYPGNCFGIVSFAKWYFENKRTSGNLKSKYSFDRDREVASDAQKILQIENYIAVWGLGRQTDREAAEQLIYNLEVTKRPQILALSKRGYNIAHAVLVYSYNDSSFYIYDPNNPSDDNIRLTYDGTNIGNYGVFEDYTVLSSSLYNPAAMNTVFYSGTWTTAVINITEGGDEGETQTMNDIVLKPDQLGTVSLGPISNVCGTTYTGLVINNTLTLTSNNEHWTWSESTGDGIQVVSGECCTAQATVTITFSDDGSGSGQFRNDARAGGCPVPSQFIGYNAGTITLSR